MCIIAVCKRALTPDEFKYCEENNSDGWGIGIYTPKEPSDLPIYVDKGYMGRVGDYKTYKSIIEVMDNALHVIHFRLTSSGKTCQELTHPFALDYDLLAKDELNYTTDKPVLFHNGHYTNWDSVLIDMVLRHGMLDGELSDTKILAWALTDIYKQFGFDHVNRLLECLDDKFAIMNPNRVINVYGQFYDSDDKLIKFSNMGFTRRSFMVCG